MNAAGTAKTWRKTNVPNLYVHRNGKYYHRVTISGKPLWETLRTKLKSVAESQSSRETPRHQSVDENDQSIDSAARRAGISRLTHHDLRHLFATTLIEHGIDIPTVARLLGHKDGGALAMRTYGHLRDEHAQKVMARVSYSDEAIPNLVLMAAASGKAE